MSEIELARLLVNGLGIAPADIKAVDTSKHKILRIGFFKGVNTDKYLNSSAVKIREDLRLQPMRSTATLSRALAPTLLRVSCNSTPYSGLRGQHSGLSILTMLGCILTV